VNRKPDKGGVTDGAGAARHVRLPGFVSDEAIGLGDVVMRATSVVGIRPCGGCAQRAEKLNKRVTFAPRQK
jgi:hypothetical protein